MLLPAMPDWFDHVLNAVGLSIVLWDAVRNRVLLRGAQSWPVLNGTVEESRVSAEHGSYTAAILFSYQLHGSFYSGERVWRCLLKRQAQATAARFPVGTTIMVHYNPAQPSQSVIDREWPNSLRLTS